MDAPSEIEHALSAEDALVAVMIAVSFSDEQIRTAELMTITQIVNHLPAFADYDADRIALVSRTVMDLFAEEDGLDALFGLVREALPAKLNETAYALACDVAASDGRLGEAELRLLEEIRHELDLDRLHAAAIERGAPRPPHDHVSGGPAPERGGPGACMPPVLPVERRPPLDEPLLKRLGAPVPGPRPIGHLVALGAGAPRQVGGEDGEGERAPRGRRGEAREP